MMQFNHPNLLNSHLLLLKLLKKVFNNNKKIWDIEIISQFQNKNLNPDLDLDQDQKNLKNRNKRKTAGKEVKNIKESHLHIAALHQADLLLPLILTTIDIIKNIVLKEDDLC